MRSNIMMSMLLISSCLLADQDGGKPSKDIDIQEEPAVTTQPPVKRQPIPLKPLFVPLSPSSKGFVAPIESQQHDVTQPPMPDRQPSYVDTPMNITVPIWLFESALAHAPELVKGICYYWKHYAKTERVASYNRLILVGKPGTGKTTLARAIAWHLGYPIYSVNASRLLGKYRNETAVKMRGMFKQFIEATKPAIILIDELHKLFELHRNEHSDDAANAATFWLALDEIEQVAPYLIIIGTANSVDSLPPEIKSRFQGKVVTIPLPSKKQRIDAFTQILKHDKSVKAGTTIDRAYISTLLDTLQDQALRDVQLLIDTAKMCKYIEQPTAMPLLLERKHFEQALAQLKGEGLMLQESWTVRWLPKLKNAGVVLSLAVNVGVLTRMMHDGRLYIAASGSARAT